MAVAEETDSGVAGLAEVAGAVVEAGLDFG